MSAHELTLVGREAVGPALALHLQLTLEWAERRRIDRIYFLAQDGHLARELAELFRERAPAARRPLRYLEVTRRSTRLAAMKRLGPSAVELPFPRTQPAASLASILAALALDDDEVRAAAVRAGYHAFERPLELPWADIALQKLLDDAAFQKLVGARAADARARLMGHLRAQDFFAGGRAALVGTGWRAIVQDQLARVIEREPGRPELHGFYLGLLQPRPPFPRESLDRKVGTMFDWRRVSGDPILDWAPLLHLFEWAGKPDGRTITGYRDERAGYAPIRDQAGDPPSVAAARRALQEGVRESVRDYVGRAPVGMNGALLVARGRQLEQLRRFSQSDEWRTLRALVDEKWGAPDEGEPPPGQIAASFRWISEISRRFRR
jgi:hypothetical protein